MSVAFSPDGKHLLTGSFDNTSKLWDVDTGQLNRTFEAHSGWVVSVAFSPDGKRVLSGSTDTTTRLWRSQTGELLATFFAARDGEWLVLTPDGFFSASSPKANKMLSIVRGLDVYGVDQVWQSLFSPDLVREQLADDPKGEVKSAAAFINLEKVLDSGPAPGVAIADLPANGKTVSDVIKLKARITDRGKGIGRIEWRVNGVTAAVGSAPWSDSQDHLLTQELALDAGDNIIEVVAYNRANVLASAPASATISYAAPPEQAKPKLHILAIGVNDYTDRGWTPPGERSALYFPKLGLAVKDATTFAEDMKRAAAGLYEDVRVTLALDGEATRDGMEKAIAKVAAEVHPRDTFILFAAAHGISENGRFYLIPQDYQGGPKALSERAIGQERIQDWLANRIKAKRALSLLDTCESGALVAGHLRARTDVPASDAAVGRLHEATGRPVLTAAAKGQFAYEGLIAQSGERHGVFTWALLDALRNGDASGDGEIELAELVGHVQAIVPSIAAKLGGDGRAAIAAAQPVSGEQTARFGSRGENFVVAHRLQ